MKFIATTSIRRNGKDYQPGEEIDVTNAEAAKVLLASGAIKEPQEQPAAPQAGEGRRSKRKSSVLE